MTLSDARVIDVEIFGKRIKLLLEDEDEELVYEAVNYLEDKMREMVKHLRSATFEKVLILASINIVLELVKLKREKELSEELLIKKSEEIIKLIDKETGNDIKLDFEEQK